ncbi:MAG: hypothetical protein EAZ07_05590 [Cytophagales bacterium]|nr:MAG: hypothetical protein EAZ07_05590 [Cytophagales bacterium]
MNIIKNTIPFFLALFIANSIFAQRVDYDKIIPSEADNDSVSIEEKLVYWAWKNNPTSEIAFIELEVAKNKKDKYALQIAEANIKALKLKIRSEVLRRYLSYTSNIELLKHKIRSQEEAHLVHLVIAKNMRKGEGSIEDYNKSLITYNEAVETKIKGETEVAHAKTAIEELLGVKLEEVTARRSNTSKMEKKGDTIVSPTGLKYIIISKGTGKKPKPGDKVEVYYTGKFLNGREFETNRKEDPFKFTIGVQQAIPGWDEGLLLMKEGERGILILPAKLAYGKSGIKDPSNEGQYMVPPDTPVMYDIEFVDLK